ncbi:MAG: hypothetical protein JKP98_12640 [Rhodobacteraceae bacterium]|jgi:hypothetical protein|nr:hypothetical protein [Alphaproteobacteria bacterium]MBL4557629.1 hypothetical protein [Paracoccaceae bacterium]
MTEHCELTEKELASLTDAQVVLALKGHYPVGNSSSEQVLERLDAIAAKLADFDDLVGYLGAMYSVANAFVGEGEEHFRPLVDRARVLVGKYLPKKETEND